MSYCRFSTNDFGCDVYVYEDVCGGFTTHVAGSRIRFREPLPDPVQFTSENLQAFVDRQNTVMRMVEEGENEPITLEHAGQSFNDPDEAACAARLERLRDLGYRIPGIVIELLREEAAIATDFGQE